MNKILLAAVLTLGLIAPALAQNTWAVSKTFHIGGTGGWDYLTLDPQTHRLYVPRSTHTMVIDATSGAVIGDIPGQKNAHGVALAPAAGRGFISDGGGAVVVFDLKTNAVLGTLPSKDDTDGIIFDPTSGLVLAVAGRGKAVVSFRADIDPVNGKITDWIDLDGEPEFLAADPSGRVYVNLMTTNKVAVVDLKKHAVVANWPVAPGGAPVGMSIDTKKGRIFIGCRNPQKLIVMSTKDGKVLGDLPIGESVDATKFDGTQIFASTAGGVLSVAAETAPGTFAIVQSVVTGAGARTMAIDAEAHKIYLPSAEYETGPNGRPVTKAGTFMILVVAQGPAK